MILLSVCIIAQNEEQVIQRCLESLDFADEIILVDGGSQDQTHQKALESLSSRHSQRLKWVSHPFRSFSEQRNVALSHASGTWVFFIDADEKASEELGQLLYEISRKDPATQPRCYSIRREEYFLGRHLTFGPGNPSFQWRFFQRQGVHFKGDLHEYPVFEGGIGIIHRPLHHWPDLNLEHVLKKMNHYTTLEAYDLFEQGRRTSLFHAYVTFWVTFLKHGFRYRAFQNGVPGLILTTVQAFSKTVRHLKLWVLWAVYEKKISVQLSKKLPEPGSRGPVLHDELNKSALFELR